MKAADLVIALLQMLRLQALDIIDTIRSGDDGFEECCKEQLMDMVKQMDSFLTEKLSPINAGDKGRPKAYQVRLPDPDGVHGLSQADSIAIYKHQLYHYLKERLKTLDLLAVPTPMLALHIEGELFHGSPFEREAQMKHWFYSWQEVLEDLAEEIKVERERNPQLGLFTLPQ